MVEAYEAPSRVSGQTDHLPESARLSRKGQRARERREELVRLLRAAHEPIVGAELARMVGVSRQMLTHDLTLLRLSGVDIMYTQHDREHMMDEMTILVDLGIHILDVGIDHPVYGPLRADLCISSRQDVWELVERLEQTGTASLAELTGGRHSHTVEAPRPDLLAKARAQLRDRGYLIK
jgi:transcriptional regulator of NAD metabolism